MCRVNIKWTNNKQERSQRFEKEKSLKERMIQKSEKKNKKAGNFQKSVEGGEKECKIG